MDYIYFYGTIIGCLLWVVFFQLRKDLRKKLVFSSILCAPLGLSEVLFVPHYWIPQFNTISIYEDLFVESILFCFFLGGIVSVLFQVVYKQQLLDTQGTNPLVTLIAPLLFFTYFFKLFPLNLMHYVVFSLLIGSTITIYFMRKMAVKILISGVLNTLLYSAFYLTFWHTMSSLPKSYQYHNLSGFMVFEIPIEEYLWIFSFSIYWTPIYEIWTNYFAKRKMA